MCLTQALLSAHLAALEPTMDQLVFIYCYHSSLLSSSFAFFIIIHLHWSLLSSPLAYLWGNVELNLLGRQEAMEGICSSGK